MKKNNKKRNNRTSGKSLGGLIAAIFWPGLLLAAPWEYGVNLELGVIHTDNLFLAQDGDEESDTVYTVAPEFYLRTEGERTQADIRYRPEAFFYSDFNDADDVYHVADANLTTALVRDRLFLYLSGVNFQSIVTPDGQIPTTNVPVSNNRIDSRTLEVRPYWQQRVGTADVLAEAGLRNLEYDSDQIQSSDETYARLSVNNFAQQQGLAWGVQYQFRRLEYERSNPFEYHRAALNLGFWATSALRLFAEGGAETAFDDLLNPNMDSDFWEFGFQYSPNKRLDVELAVGQRDYGSSFRADVAYTLRRGNLRITYDETPSTRAESVFDTRPLQNTDLLDSILDRPGNTDRFIRKRGEVQLGIDLSKSGLTFRAFSENREKRTTEAGATLPKESIEGVAVRWDWRFGAKTTLDLGLDIARRDDSSRDDNLRQYTVGLDYEMSQRTGLRVEGLRSEQDGKLADNFDYTENQLRLLLTMELK